MTRTRPCTRPYTAVYGVMAHEHGRVYGPCARLVHVRVRTVYTAVHNPNTVGYTVTRPCAGHEHGRLRPVYTVVHRCVRTVHTAVHGPCTCVYGRVHGSERPVYTAVYRLVHGLYTNEAEAKAKTNAKAEANFIATRPRSIAARLKLS